MAISPVADIVLEVARAADPAGYRAATARLRNLAGTAPSGKFQEIAGSVAPQVKPAPRLPFDAASALVHLRNGEALAVRQTSPYERFEAFVLQTFVQAMLPKGDSALFGSGTAGEIWKSMLAKGLSTELARSGGIGIAEMLSDAIEGTERRSAAGAVFTRSQVHDSEAAG
ncbi:MAG TPA: rod-binding protein [Paracoccaceae bacterium]|nr:rod-binding protein [Paracoccaceae bacterium]